MLNHNNLSYWERKTYLDKVDHIIIGAGIVGYSCAIHLKKKFPDAKILILERGYLPSGASSKNAGFACFGSPTEIWDDLKHISEDKVWSTVEKRWRGLNYLREIIGDKHLSIEQNGSWDLIINRETEAYSETLDRLDHFNKQLYIITGKRDVYSEDSAISSKFGFKGIATSFYNKLEAQIDTSLMNKKFHALALELGIDILFDHEVSELQTTNIMHSVITKYGTISAQNIFITTNGFAKQLLPELDVEPARAQVLITEPIKDLKLKGTFHYDMGYYYFRNIDNRILLGGGRNIDFKAENTTKLETTEAILSRLKSLLNNNIMPDSNPKIEYSWAGVMGVGQDKEPIVKEIKPGVYCGVRMGGMGVAIGSLIGKELSEFI